MLQRVGTALTSYTVRVLSLTAKDDNCIWQWEYISNLFDIKNVFTRNNLFILINMKWAKIEI